MKTTEQYENILGYSMECSECDLAPHPCGLHQPEEYEKDLQQIQDTLTTNKRG